VFLAPIEAVLSLHKPMGAVDKPNREIPEHRATVLRMRLLGGIEYQRVNATRKQEVL
jgi:hypothetical protein